MAKLSLRFWLSILLAAGSAHGAEILWDRYGIPHIFGKTAEDVFFAHGWAQMRNHADLLLQLYGESRGRSAEYWGPAGLEADKWVRINGVPELAQKWYAQQDPVFRKNLDAFARGINAYAAANPAGVSPEFRVVLPVTGVDVVGHSLRVVHFGYMGSQAALRAQAPIGGSNTWAVGPSRSASKKAMLLINPHLQWGGFYTYMEVHLVGPGLDVYGSPQIGFPVPVNGFNTQAGWGRTVNTIDTVDFYRLTVRNGQYEFDGKLRPFERSTATLKIKRSDGGLREEKIEVLRTVHGAVVQDGIAMRVAGTDRPRMLEQWYRMAQATNLGQFRSALAMQSVPMWTANYADAAGHIYMVSNGLVPRRSQGDWNYWARTVPGNTSKTLWTEYLRVDELPQVLDPPSGFTQNANEPPWLSTLPQLDATRFPAWLAPSPAGMPSFRTRRSLRMISEDQSITFEELMAHKHDTRMEVADAVLPDLLRAAGSSAEAAVLRAWDRHVDAGSRGAVLFQIFADNYLGLTTEAMQSKLRIPYDARRPLDSGVGLNDPPAAAAALAEAGSICRRLFGALDVPWGDVFRFHRGSKDVPANGGPSRLGVFRTMEFQSVGGHFQVRHGDTFTCAVEFGDAGRAQCALGYGNASQPGSKHIDDQLELLSRKQMRPVWRTRADIERNLEFREVAGP